MSNPPPPPAGRIPAFVRSLRWVLFALLLLAAGASLVGLPRVVAGRWPTGVALLPVVLLALFIVGYAAYRFALVKAGRYPAGKAYLNVGAMVLGLGVITGIVLEPPRLSAEVGTADLAPALTSPDPLLRALAAELARHRPRPDGLRQAGALVRLLDDADPSVRREAHASLVVLSGEDLGAGPGTAERWRHALRAQGILANER